MIRKRLFLIFTLVLIPSCGFVSSGGPRLLSGRVSLFGQTRAFGWSDPAVAVTVVSHNEWMIRILPFFPSIKEVRLGRMSPHNQATSLKDRLARLAGNPWVVSLDLGFLKLTDKDVAALANMSQLEWLDLSANPEITDMGIAHLAKCTRLRCLTLEGTAVTPAGIAALKECQHLEYLSMGDCVVTDDNVMLIPRFPKMNFIRFHGTDLTEKGLQHFLNWHFLKTFAVKVTTTRESQVEFNKRFVAEWERAHAAGEDVPPKKPPRGY
jgi:hypothetical protein